MPINIAPETEYGTPQIQLLIEPPTMCPHCSVAIRPIYLYSYLAYFSDNYHGILYALFSCPQCKEVFLATYSHSDESGENEYLGVLPHTESKVSFSENINVISPDFVEIYNQAYLAEQSELTRICGMGYRKALEFLVKDYAIYKNPDDSDKISSMSLAQCIDKYIQPSMIKTLAKASAWIGNDETHYQRKHPDVSFEELKAYISALVSFIDMEANCELAGNFINSYDHKDR